MRLQTFLSDIFFLASLVTLVKGWHWRCTDSSKVVINGTEVLVSANSTFGKQVNCIYECGGRCKGMRHGSYYWEFKFSKGHAAVGITTKDHFKDGNSIRGLFYDGNLKNGAERLSQESEGLYSFGDEIKENDTIGFLIELKDESLLVYIYHNNRPLGLAANFTAPYAKPLFPAIYVTDEAHIRIIKSDGRPQFKQRKEDQHHGIIGYWTIARCEDEGKLISNPNWRAYNINIKPNNDNETKEFIVLINIVNDISVTLAHFTPKNLTHPIWTLSQSGLSLSSTHGDAGKAEDFLLKFFNNFKDLDFNDSAMVWIGRRQMKMILKRYKGPVPSPLIRNPMQMG